MRKREKIYRNSKLSCSKESDLEVKQTNLIAAVGWQHFNFLNSDKNKIWLLASKIILDFFYRQ